jgi:hypothetical protein
MGKRITTWPEIRRKLGEFIHFIKWCFKRPIFSRKSPCSRRQTAASPGPNPTTSIYNASVVNFYNATGSLARL